MLIDFLGIQNKELRMSLYKVIRKILRFAKQEIAIEFMKCIPWESFTEQIDDNEINSEMIFSVQKICNYHISEIAELHKAGCFESLFNMFFEGSFCIKFKAFKILSLIIQYFKEEDVEQLFNETQFVEVVYDMVDEDNEELMVHIVKFLVSMNSFGSEGVNRPLSETFVTDEFMDIVSSYLDSDDEKVRRHFEDYNRIVNPETDSED